MTKEELIKSEDNIKCLIEKQYKDSIDNGVLNVDEIEPITDGIFNINEYINADYKILWILQEPYDSDGGGWHMRVRVDDAIKNGRFNRDWRTWEKVLYVSWSILNSKKDNSQKYSLLRWDKIPDYHDNPEMLKVLEKIAYINVKKLPNITGTNRDYEEIRTAYKQNREILVRQILDYCPQIIIGGYTLNLLYNDLEISDDMIFKPEGKSVYYCFKNHNIYVDAYHPANRKFYDDEGRKKYCDDILTVVEEWMNHSERK